MEHSWSVRPSPLRFGLVSFASLTNQVSLDTTEQLEATMNNNKEPCARTNFKFPSIKMRLKFLDSLGESGL